MLLGLSLTDILLILPAVLAAVILHELAHGVVARALGDPTAERAGRLTLNPIPHIDWIGLLALIFFHFGWAKPVPVDPRYFRRPYRDMVLVALAGPLTNGLWALVLAFPLVIVAAHYPAGVNSSAPVVAALLVAVEISVALGIFNLLPVPPLDGSHFLSALWPAATVWVTRFGFVLLIVLVLSGVVGHFLLPLVLAVTNVLLHFAYAATGFVGH
jgi:Zn-dependent protease